jgi:hypothetical protein
MSPPLCDLLLTEVASSAPSLRLVLPDLAFTLHLESHPFPASYAADGPPTS